MVEVTEQYAMEWRAHVESMEERRLLKRATRHRSRGRRNIGKTERR
jgi:hypothetical protein